MSEEFQQILFVQFIGVLTTVLLVGIPALGQWRKWRTGEREQANSASEKTDAETASLWHETYEKMYHAGIERDDKIAQLNKTVLDLQAQLNLKSASEQFLRDENNRLQRRVSELEDTLKRERLEHVQQIQELNTRISKLEDNQNARTITLSVSGDQPTGGVL